ncbi:MAG: glycosyltransferase family 4 protein [Thermodesulfovibrionales bacterium]|jgi:glycosyltransferase involved in cell wall biosynthesis
MRILQIIYETPGSPFGFGGAGVRAYEIYRRLATRHDITLLALRYRDVKDGRRDGLQHTFVGTESSSLFWSVLSYTVKAASFVRRHGNTFDLIIENFLPSTPFFTRFLTKTPVVLQVQGIMEWHSFKKFSLFYSLPISLVEWFYPFMYKKFIFVSPVTKEKVLAKVKGAVAFCPVIPNGINEELLDLAPGDENYILFLSRIDIYTKGLDLLVRAFEKISEKFAGIDLVLAGYEFDPFDALVSKLPPAVKKRIRYAGFVTGEEKVRLLSRATFSVLPSRHESSPISVLEAAACGKPVLVSDIPELRFVEENGFGLSFRSGSVDDLAEKMGFLMKDTSGRQLMSRSGKDFAKNFSWETIALQFEDALKTVVTSSR